MKRCHRKSPLFVRCFCLAVVGCVLFASTAFSQEGKGPKSIEEGKRPRSIDEGQATVTRRSTGEKRIVAPPPSPGRSAYNWIVIRPEAAGAEVTVAIDGKVVSKSVYADYRKELPVGRSYRVRVSAGSDYETYDYAVSLNAREPFIKNVLLKYKFGSVKIVTAEAALKGAKILVNGKPQTAKIDRVNSALIVDRVEPGANTITFDHPDYVLYERNALIEADTEYTWSFIPERPFGELDILTDPKTIVYVDDEPKGETTPEGKLKLSDIKIGPHQVKLIKNGFEEYNAVQAVAFKKTVNIQHKLIPKHPSTYFNSNFMDADANAWVLSNNTVKIEANHLNLNNVSALAYPKGIFYWDFEMQFHLTLRSDFGAAWALRVADPNNYYLFCLSGPKGPIPNTFISYIVRDGKLDLMRPAVSPSPILVYPELGYEYTIMIQARGNVINHKIVPSKKNLKEKEQVGNELTLGTFTDTDSLFLFGGFGFRSVRTEAFSISELYVTPHESASPKR